jgi:hypothetical protein
MNYRTSWLFTKCFERALLMVVLTAYWQTTAQSEVPTRQIRWEPVGLSGGGGMFTPAISPADPNLMMLNCDMSAAYISQDSGQTWQRIGRQARQTFGGYFHPKHDGWIYMTLTEGAAGAGLWLSQDNGRTWQAFDDLPFSNIQRVSFDPSDDAVMFVTTFGGSVWRGPAVPHVK